MIPARFSKLIITPLPRDIWKSVSVPALVVGFVFDVFSQEDSVLQEQWVREFGPTLKFHGA